MRSKPETGDLFSEPHSLPDIPAGGEGNSPGEHLFQEKEARRGSISWFAKKQVEYREAGEKYAREYWANIARRKR